MSKAATVVAKMFLGARAANLARHAANGTLAKHLLRKAWIKHVIRILPFPGDRR